MVEQIPPVGRTHQHNVNKDETRQAIQLLPESKAPLSSLMCMSSLIEIPGFSTSQLVVELSKKSNFIGERGKL